MAKTTAVYPVFHQKLQNTNILLEYSHLLSGICLLSENFPLQIFAIHKVVCLVFMSFWNNELVSSYSRMVSNACHYKLWIQTNVF